MAAILARSEKMKPIPIAADYRLASYNFALPENQIAQFPPEMRGHSRLMVLSEDRLPLHALFDDLASYLPPNALLVANNSRVVQSRLLGKRKSGGKAEFLLLTPLPLIEGNNGYNEVEGLIRPAGRIKIGDSLDFGPIKLKVIQKSEFGQCRANLSWNGDLTDLLGRIGHLPLPPYIKREPESDDYQRYQTIYAKAPGSIAAPTAGLHFTQELRDSLLAQGFEWLELSLHVGYGTFSPVRSADIRQHQMHAEYSEISESAASTINQALKTRRPIIAIGTTSCRCLEGVFAKYGEIRPHKGMINLFLYPGSHFNVISGLLTNFHLPQSSLLMLVAAFAGRERILSAYQNAVQNNYRFFSYGDAMLITP